MLKLWKPLISPVFLIGVLSYACVRLARMGYFELPQLINNYLSDLVCMPIILTFCLIGVRVIKRLPEYELIGLQVFSMATFYAVFFEGFLPLYSDVYTADAGDVLAYYLGAGCYYFFLEGIGFQASAKEVYEQV